MAEDWKKAYGVVCVHSDGTSHGAPACPGSVKYVPQEITLEDYIEPENGGISDA